MRHLTYWAMNIDLTREELETIQEFEELVGVSIALSNDYYSWDMEKLQKTDRVRNAVPLLMKQYSLPEHAAKDLLKGMIVDTEQRAKEAKMQLFEDESLTENLKRYIHGWELYAGGISYWSATCMRYGKPQ
jgi:phytoene/squalene synthetase